MRSVFDLWSHNNKIAFCLSAKPHDMDLDDNFFQILIHNTLCITLLQSSLSHDPCNGGCFRGTKVGSRCRKQLFKQT